MVWALRAGIITNHPFKNERHPISNYHFKIKEKDPTVLTNNEIKQMLDRLKDKPHNLTVFMGYLLTGCRKMELGLLTWDMADFSAGVIRFTTPKTGKSRVIPMSPQLRAMLEKMSHEWPGNTLWHPRTPEQMKYVFCSRNGKPFTQSLGLFIPRLSKKLGLRNIHLHSLRHTFATRSAPYLSAFELQ